MVGASEQAKPSNEEIRAALTRIVTSKVFGRSERARDLLTYLVEQEISGRGSLLKGFSVAQDVFGRGEDFDPSTDAVVRVQVGRLRENLASYYSSEGKHDPIGINVPLGSYIPAYSFREVDGPEMTGSKDVKDEESVSRGGELDFGQEVPAFEIDETVASSADKTKTKRSGHPVVDVDTPVSPFVVSSIRRIWAALALVLFLLALIVYLVWDFDARADQVSQLVYSVAQTPAAHRPSA